MVDIKGLSSLSRPNGSYLYYKDYFRNINDLPDWSEEEQKRHFNQKNESITTRLKFAKNSLNPCEKLDSNVCFNLELIYPGLLIGSGYNHDVKAQGATKIGFYFDHTTGLPIIPGSSVKGRLRSFFPDLKEKRDLNEDNQEENTAKGLIIWELLYGEDKKDSLTHKEWLRLDRLQLQIFEGIVFKKGKGLMPTPVYQRDIFYDAIPTVSEDRATPLFGMDYITPHKDGPLKNPNPIPFIKVLPRVQYSFSFRLSAYNNKIDSQLKERLFKSLLLLFGIGAKTNVGYGQFQEV